MNAIQIIRHLNNQGSLSVEGFYNPAEQTENYWKALNWSAVKNPICSLMGTRECGINMQLHQHKNNVLLDTQEMFITPEWFTMIVQSGNTSGDKSVELIISQIKDDIVLTWKSLFALMVRIEVLHQSLPVLSALPARHCSRPCFLGVHPNSTRFMPCDQHKHNAPQFQIKHSFNTIYLNKMQKWS